MLRDKDLALLAAKLEVPIVVSDLIDGRTAFTEDVQYGLHEMISDFEPDTALLAIALSTKLAVNAHAKRSTNTNILALECDKIIEEYGPLWLQHAGGKTPDTLAILDVLEGTAEDLEALASLLDSGDPALSENNPLIGALSQILGIQARAQSLVAEVLLDTAGKMADHESNAIQTAPIPAVQTHTDNVIPFRQRIS